MPMGACHSYAWISWLRTTKSAPPSLIPSQTEPSVMIWKSRGGMEARVRSERSLCWDGDILLSTGVMTVGIGEACPMEERKAALRRGGVESKPGD